MDFRFFIQPMVASLLAIRAGIRDARNNNPPFLWTIFTDNTARPTLLQQARIDITKVFILALILDSVYQLITVSGIYLLELLFTATILAIVPYCLIRGPVNRITRWWKSTEKKEHLDAH